MTQNNGWVAMVEQIPVDQAAKATSDIKKFLLKKVEVIRERRNTIDQITKNKRREQILEDYKKAFGWPRFKKQLDELEKKVKDLKEKITQAGLTVHGDLINIKEKYPDQDGNMTVYMEGTWIKIPPDTLRKIEEVMRLLKAVEGEMEPFGLFDQLETRMMMAGTVGEAMAIVNALTGAEVFKIDTETLGLSSPGQRKQLKDKETK